jgi:hypothetical protein
MILIQFEAFASYSTSTVWINPECVVSVVEKEASPPNGFIQKVAVIELTTGDKHTVYDLSRDAAQRLAKTP